MFEAIFAHGGWILGAIIMASLLAGAAVCERAFRLLPLRSRFDGFWQEVSALVRKGDAASAEALAKKQDHAAARIVCRGFAASRTARDIVRDMSFEAAQHEIPGLEKRLGVISTVAHVTPLLGLLGTVAGLIEAFRAASEVDAVTASNLADGIYMALGTTAAGLVVGIPAWIAYHALAGVANGLITQLELIAGELPLLLEESQ